MTRKWTMLAVIMGVGIVAAEARAAVSLPGGSPVPGAVVRDNTGEIVGAVIGFNSQRPVIVLRNGSERAMLFMEEDFTFSAPFSVYYTSSDCTGSPAAIESFTKFASKGFMEWQGRVYSIGNGNVLVRNTNTTSQSISVSSRFISVNTPPNQCVDLGGPVSEPDLFPAEVVDDLDAVFAPPYTLE